MWIASKSGAVTFGPNTINTCTDSDLAWQNDWGDMHQGRFSNFNDHIMLGVIVRQMRVTLVLSWLLLVASCAFAAATVRVALFDMTVDDNSYRSIWKAADFTSLVQLGLKDEPGVEWVERAQISLARQEFHLAGPMGEGGLSTLRQGWMLGADWLVTGHFSSDDQSRSTLSVQVIELKHADVLTAETMTLPDPARGWSQLDSNQVAFVVGSLKSLFVKARLHQQEVANEARVAFLFLADTSSWPVSDQGTAVLAREFSDGLERASATNGRIRLIRFPKAYQATDESELVVDGIIEAGQDAWSRTADLYVWGTYSVTNTRTLGRMGYRLGLVLNLWDGVSQPVVLKDSLTLGARGNLPPERASELINRLIGEVVARARPQRDAGDSEEVRQQIADSIVKSYRAMTGGGRSQVGLHNREKLVQAVHLLETACYFDPDNAEARALWLTCRYGWWIDFGFAVKNQFWTKWRRSQAWGDYVQRFGLKPVGVELPFPYGQRGLPSTYLRSLEDVIGLCPEHFEWSELEPHGPMREAQFHGFPKEISNSIASKWKSELQAEYWKRLTTVVEFIKRGNWTLPEKQPPTILSDIVRGILGARQAPSVRLALLEEIWPECAKCAQRFGQEWIIGAGKLADDTERSIANLCVQAGKPEKAKLFHAMVSEQKGKIAEYPPTHVTSTNTFPASTVIQSAEETSEQTRSTPQPKLSIATPIQRSGPGTPTMVPAPEWLKNHMAIYGMFRLYPPNALPREPKPKGQRVQFPPQFEVKVIRQLAYQHDRLWILAMDERSSPSSAATPDLSGETLNKRNRLWRLEAAELKPDLFKADALPARINSFLLQEDQLWLAGDAVGVMDLNRRSYRRFGLTEGLTLKEVEALAVVAGRTYAAGDSFKLSSFDPAASRWNDVPLSARGGMSHGTDTPYLLAGHQQWLGYAPGSTLFCDLLAGSWTNLAQLNSTCCIAADGSIFWIGAEDGLHCYEADTQTLRNWQAPTFIQSPMISLMGNAYFGGNASLPQNRLEEMDGQIRNRLAKMEEDRKQTHAARVNEPAGMDTVPPRLARPRESCRFAQ